jgi:hypothetical protein
MADQNEKRGPRQVTVQPQELPPDAGQPHVPHTRVKTPGGESPESDADDRAAPASEG